MTNTAGPTIRIDEATYKRMPTHLQALFTKSPNPRSEEVAEAFAAFGESRSSSRRRDTRAATMGYGWASKDFTTGGHDDTGTPARFFYCAKASKKDREEGLEHLPTAPFDIPNGAQVHGDGYDKGQGIGLNKVRQVRNNHPTVKNTALMEWLIKLVSKPGDTVLDCFLGSGSTGKACRRIGRKLIGIEQDPAYFDIAVRRIQAACDSPTPTLFPPEPSQN